MLTINPRQIVRIETGMATRFENELVAHAADFVPAAYASMGEASARETVRLGLSRAGDHGFSLRGSLRFYIELMLLFGSDFDTDPQHRWASATLAETERLEDLARADRLHAEMKAYLAETSGADNAAEIRARDRLIEELNTLTDPAHSAADLQTHLAAIFPEKAWTIGTKAIRAVIDEGFEAASARGEGWAQGGPLFATLMGTFGHGCLADPQFSWISGTLTDDGAPGASLERLRRKFAAYLDHTQRKAT